VALAAQPAQVGRLLAPLALAAVAVVAVVAVAAPMALRVGVSAAPADWAVPVVAVALAA
jgi:hypothetical protein